MAPDQSEKPIPKKPKTPVFKTGNPYSAPRWPTINTTLQESILLSLCELLCPIGEWRKTIPRSKGKRHKQRERKRKCIEHEAQEGEQVANATQPEPQPAPLIAQHITVGLNTTVRALIPAKEAQEKHPVNVAVVFLTQPTDSIQYAHLPVLAAQSRPPVVLVPLTGSEAQLCAVLGLARVGMIGITREAPGGSALMAFVDEVEPVQVPFLEEVKKGQWVGVKIESVSADTVARSKS